MTVSVKFVTLILKGRLFSCLLAVATDHLPVQLNLYSSVILFPSNTSHFMLVIHSCKVNGRESKWLGCPLRCPVYTVDCVLIDTAKQGVSGMHAIFKV